MNDPVAVDADENQFDEWRINASTVRWTARLFNMVRGVLGVRLNLHHDEGQLAEGDIFVFNHFARFETFIPQYFLYQQLGVHARAVASAEFFAADDALGRYLKNVGAVPNDMPGLLPFLAAEILRGRPLVVFPEGGMVKDRRVLHDGELSVYSRTAGERRKHHSGPAVLALVLDAFKAEVRRAAAVGDVARLEHFSRGLDFEAPEQLVTAANRPTRIIPCNITFHPIRVDEHVLSRALAGLGANLTRRAMEELLVEGNILLRDTDMDIRLGEAVAPESFWGEADRRLTARIARRFNTMEDFFAASREGKDWRERLLATTVAARVYRIRDEYMARMYQAVTINLSHLASALIMALADRARTTMAASEFAERLYLLVKHVQKEPGVHLHHGIREPDQYAGLLDGTCGPFDRFIGAKAAMELVALTDGELQLLPKLLEEHDFDEIRLGNLIAVYDNEVAPIEVVGKHARASADRLEPPTSRALALARFDDELMRHEQDLEAFTRPEHADINDREIATLSGAPWLLHARDEDHLAPLGVVLVHGFLASPAEVRRLGEWLNARDLPVLGVRLRGHGTSPWDLHSRSVDDWLESVANGQCIMRGLALRVIVVGFSTGGTLALIRAGEAPSSVDGVVAVNVSAGFVDPRMRLVGLVHGANVMVGSVTRTEGIMPFRPNVSENPDINYASIPVRGLAELVDGVERLGEAVEHITSPVLMLQSNSDPVVDAAAARALSARMGQAEVSFVPVASTRHGIVHEPEEGVFERIGAFVDLIATSECREDPTSARRDDCDRR